MIRRPPRSTLSSSSAASDVYKRQGLKQCSTKNIHVLEIGFGTGLNALLTWGEAKRSNLNITYITVEAFPLPLDIISAIGYDTLEPSLPIEAIHQMHQATWN